MNKLRKAVIAGSILGVGTGGTAAYLESQPSDSQRVAAAQHQILETAKRNVAHPPSPNAEDGMAEYNASGTAQDAQGIREAKALTARRVAKLSFDKAFNEASDVGGIVIDVSDMTGLPVKTVLKETLPNSTVTALNNRNIHFVYNSPECNPMVMEAQNGRPAEGYIPLTASASPPQEGQPVFQNSNIE